MSVFIEINRINSHNENVKALVRVDDIVGINQKHVDSVKLYDENHNVVSETPATTKDFQVLVVSEHGNTEKFHVDENEYNRLSQILLSIE